MITLLEALKKTTDHLTEKGFTNARRQAEELFCDALNLQSRIDLYTQFERPLVEKELQHLRSRLKRRISGEPAAYIHGCVSFYGCSIQVKPSVLIPRQETELLVDMAVQYIKTQENNNKKTLVDLCCGSGCIAIALKKTFPEMTVIASDISNEALSVAKENAKQNNVEIEFRQGDFLSPLSDVTIDYFICNPPYISESEMTTLNTEVSNWEPHLALCSGPTGLEFYERLAQGLKPLLSHPAKAWLEISTGQGEAISMLFKQYEWRNFSYQKDYSGHDRFFSLEIE